MALYDRIRPYTALYGPIRPYTPLFHMALYGHICPFYVLWPRPIVFSLRLTFYLMAGLWLMLHERPMAHGLRPIAEGLWPMSYGRP